MKKNRIGDTKQDKVYYAIVNVMVMLFAIIALYPMIFMVSCSFSSADALFSGKVFLWPVEPTLEGFRMVFKNSQILTGYRNSIFYTVVGTFLNVMVTMGMCYALSRKNLRGKSKIMLFIYFAGVVSGGAIPAYVLYTKLHMVNTIWMMIIPGIYNMYFLIVGKTMLASSLPDEVLEASKIDGCSDFRFFFTMVIPLSTALIAIIAFNCAMGHWNDYFCAMIYLRDERLYPLQLVLRNILIKNQVSSDMLTGMQMDQSIMLKKNQTELLKYATIVVSMIPTIALMPFMQKYFVQGTMLGSVKG